MYIYTDKTLGTLQEPRVVSTDNLTENFSLSEFASRGTPVPEPYLSNVKRLAENLQVLRNYLGKPIQINSAYRTLAHNTSVNGAKNSQHLVAKAADITVKGLKPNEVYCAVETLIAQGQMQQGGLGLYPTFVHYDVRDTRNRWQGKGVLVPSCGGATTKPASSLDLAKAVRKNSEWSQKLGWSKHLGAIMQLVGYVPFPYPDLQKFAEAVARWQSSQALLPADGIIGPNTWKRIQSLLRINPIVTTPVIPSSTVTPVLTNIPPLGGQKIPSGFRGVKRKDVLRGVERYGGDRLDKTLSLMRNKGMISILDADLDTLQRIANVETGGKIQGINTWDSAVVSIGFMQWTLQHGKLQEWIDRAPNAFRRYGIAVDNTRFYLWKDSKGNANKQRAIEGAVTKDELRWNGWAERFFLAGLDPEIIAAEVPLALLWLQKHLNGLKNRLKQNKMLDDFTTFKAYYDQSPEIRGIFQAAYNNLPVAALNGTTNALLVAKQESKVDTQRFLEVFRQTILQAYLARNDNGRRIITETAAGARK